jgi:hypothetical protein
VSVPLLESTSAARTRNRLTSSIFHLGFVDRIVGNSKLASVRSHLPD